MARLAGDRFKKPLFVKVREAYARKGVMIQYQYLSGGLLADLPSGLIGSRLSLYRNGRGFESRQLQDIVFLNTLSISPVLTCSECVLC